MKRVLSLCFAAALLCSLVLGAIPAEAAEERFSRASTLVSGETYMFSIPGMRGTATTDKSSHDYLLMGVESPSGMGMAFEDRPVDWSGVDDALWKVEKVSGGWTFFSLAEQKYLSMELKGSAGRTFLSSSPKTLTVQLVDGKVKISSQLGGKTHYVRFTTAYATQSGRHDYNCWHAGATDGSNAFGMYRVLGKEPEYKNTGEPLFTVACFSDLHVDYGIQSQTPPIRPSTVTSADFVRNLYGGVNVALIGGDLTSQNDSRAVWTNDLVVGAQKTIYETIARSTKDGKVFMVTGNHDNEAGVAAGDTIYSGDYDKYLKENSGEFVSSLRFNDMSIGTSKYNELLCYRYTVENIEFLSLNTPYRPARGDSYIYGAQIDWLERQLKSIGKNKTVIVQSHYPLSDIVSPANDPTGNSKTKMATLLKSYPNVIYCYGHIHDGETNYAWYTSSELISGLGEIQSDNSYTTVSYMTCHMGSMGYYNNQFRPGGLTAQEPGINQTLVMEFYVDHITFRYYNTGEETAADGVRELSSVTVKRDLSAQLGHLHQGPIPPFSGGDSGSGSGNSSGGAGGSSGGTASTDTPIGSSSGTQRPSWSDSVEDSDEQDRTDAPRPDENSGGQTDSSDGTDANISDSSASESSPTTETDRDTASESDSNGTATDSSTQNDTSSPDDSQGGSALVWVAIGLSAVAVLAVGGLCAWYFLIYKKS